MYQAKWFKPDGEHSLMARTGIPEAHLFYDLTPEFSKDNLTVNVVITTPANSENNYRFDMLSGRRHFAYSYCLQGRPEFSIGHIPRMLDQLGNAQKVVVFGSPDKISNLLSYNFFRVKLIGAYVENICPQGKCEKKSLLSRLVFIAVDTEDKQYRDVTDLTTFLTKVNWEKIKPNLENADGKNFSGGADFDYITVTNPINFAEAFNFFKTHSIYMSDVELTKIRKSCHILYEKLWKDVGVERKEDKFVTTVEELKEKAKYIEEMRQKRLPVGFSQRFQAFTRAYFDEITICNKFVYSGNVNKNPDKFWFLSYVNLYFNLHRDGYYYDCQHQSWQRNVLDNRGNLTYNIKKEIDRCDDDDLDKSMAYILSFVNALKNSDEQYKFVDYDNHVFGSHDKLYSWVKIPVKKFACVEDKNERIRKESILYPEDVKWKNRYHKDDMQSRMKIIQ